MKLYRWTSRKAHRHPQADGTSKFVYQGETLELSDSAALAFRDKIEPVEAPVAEPEAPASTPQPPAVDTTQVADGDRNVLINVNANDASAFIDQEENVVLLTAWREAETNHPKFEGGRKKVLEAIDARLAALQQQ
jgi:hypothetical protein